MALNAYARLVIGGEPVPTALGEDRTVSTMGGLDMAEHIEVVYFRTGAEISGRDGAPAVHGHRQFQPSVLVTRMGQALPRLAQALRDNLSVDVELKLFGLNHDTGEVEHQTTFAISEGRLNRLEVQHPNTLNPESATQPTLLRLTVVPHSVRWVSQTGGSEFEDTTTTGG